MCLHTVSSILDEQYNWLLSAAGQWGDKFGRGPVFFLSVWLFCWFNNAVFQEATMLRKTVALRCALNGSQDLALW